MGEKGVRFSGGQKQRVELPEHYTMTDLIVFDEAGRLWIPKLNRVL